MNTITIRYGADRMQKTVECSATVADIKANSSIRAGLGFGDNIRVLHNGVALPNEAIVPNGADLVIETSCNSKAQDQKSITIRYGADKIEKVVPYGATFESIRHNGSIKAALGFGDNIRMLVNGVSMPMEASISNGSEVVIETACNSKAS